MKRMAAGIALCLAAANFASGQTVARSWPGQPSLAEVEQNPAGERRRIEHLQNPSQSGAYQPISGKERVGWVVLGTVGPRNLAGGVFTSAYSTALNNPREYGPGWEGFGKRYGIRLTGVGTSNLMEAGMGALWGEDPRYFRAPGESFGKRVKNIIRLTFVTRRRDGNYRPAYARFIAIPGNNFLSNTWRADSEARTQDALVRTIEGFLGQMAANAFGEFWPDLKGRVFHRNH
jgi:hypothetical protein